MLGYILQALARQIGPAVRRIPPALITNSARIAAREIPNWYNSLSPTEKARVDKVILWAIKDLTADAITMCTGIPVRPFVNMAFDLLKEYKGNSEAERYVESEIKKQMELRSIKPL